MRFWLIAASSIALILAGCAAPTVDKGTKAASLTGKQEVKLRLAHSTEEAGDFAGAEKLYEEVVAQDPKVVESQLELAAFYKRHRQYSKAIFGLNAASRLEPKNTNIMRDLANTFINISEPREAINILNKAIAINDKDPLLYNSKGVALDQTGNFKEAQKSYKKAFAIDPAGGVAYKVNLSMSYILSGADDKAIELLRPMIDVPDAPPIVRQNLALAYGLKGDTDMAQKLGLQDLSNSEVEQNIRFYRMLAQKGNPDGKTKTGGATSLPPSVIHELFPETEPATSTPIPSASAFKGEPESEE